LSEAWKEEFELPPASPAESLSDPHTQPLDSSKLSCCVRRLLQSSELGFCRIAKQQWGLPTPQQKEKCQTAYALALFENLEQKANPHLPQGKGLWPYIENFLEQALHPQLKSLTNKPALFSSLLSDLANPDNILPEPPSIATLASLHQELARDFPVEYMRACCLLASTVGEFTMLGGDALRLAEAAPFVYSASVSSALMEATFYGYLLRRSAFDSLLSETFKNNNPTQHISLAPWLLPPLIRQLFGISYESETLWSPQDAASALLKLAPIPQMLPNRPVLFHLATPQEKHLQQKQQTVVFEAMREKKVFFRNNMGKLFSLPFQSFAAQALSLSFPT